jgi:hypothetical protein
MLLNLQEQEFENIQKIARYCQRFQFLNTGLMLYSDTQAFIEIFSGVYQNFIQQTPAKTDILCYVLKEGIKKSPIAVVNGLAYPLFADDYFFSHAHMLVFQHIIDAIDDHMLIHAGVVAKNGQGIIISGPSSFGKTTLMLELVARGYKFYSDEFCAVRLSDFKISSFPRSLGIRNNSPFLHHIDVNKCLLLKNIGRGEKFLINCEELFPGSIGSYCEAYCFILLRGIPNEEQSTERTIIDLALYRRNQKLIDSLCEQCGIELRETFEENLYLVYRFSITRGAGITNTFRAVCDRFRDDIFYQEQLVDEQPDFSALPTIQTLSKSRASLEMLKNLRNRATTSKLLERFSGKNSLLLLTIGNFLKEIDCYEMRTGSLQAMAEIIDAL